MCDHLFQLLIALVTLVASASEVEDVEQKKRGASKTTTLNAIPTGAQKPEYTYSIYTQNPQSNPSPTYSQNQVPNSFYPSQSGSPNQYYSQTNVQDQSSFYPPQPQINLIPPPTTSQFIPLNFVPNPGYQAKYQIFPSKSQNGNLQLTIIPQQPALVQSPSLVSLPQSLFSPTPNHVSSHQQSLYNQIPAQGQYNFGSNLQSFPYVGHPSMYLLAQPGAPVYNNYAVPNPAHNLYNYYQSSPQAKHNFQYAVDQQANVSPQSNNDYDKFQSANIQSVSKEDNEISIHGNDYITPSESNTNYKNAYTPSHVTYKT